MLNVIKVASGSILGAAVVFGGISINNNRLPDSAIVGTTTTTVRANVVNSVGDIVSGEEKKQTVTILQPKEEQLIIFNTPVAYETVEATIQRLEQLKDKGYKEAYLLLDSPGGSVFDGARLVAWMKDSPMKVHTVCDGMCASMAAHLFEAGKNRYMTSKSTLMFHPASGGVNGTLEQMASRLNFITTFVDRMDASAAERAGIDYNEFKRRTLVEYWVETEDAVGNGLADGVAFISYPRDSKKSLDLGEEMRKAKRIIPEDLKKIGTLVLETIRLKSAE